MSGSFLTARRSARSPSQGTRPHLSTKSAQLHPHVSSEKHGVKRNDRIDLRMQLRSFDSGRRNQGECNFSPESGALTWLLSTRWGTGDNLCVNEWSEKDLRLIRKNGRDFVIPTRETSVSFSFCFSEELPVVAAQSARLKPRFLREDSEWSRK